MNEQSAGPMRLGVIGPGRAWHALHKEPLLELGDAFRCVAFASRRPETRERAVADFPGACGYESAEALLADADVQGVVVTTPIPLNGPTALAAVSAGKHVFVEKPLATNSAEADAIAAAAGKAGVGIYVLENAVYGERERCIVDACSADDLGPALAYEKTHHAYMSPGTDAEAFAAADWRLRGEYPLGHMLDGGIHHLATFAEMFGAPRSVAAVGQSSREAYGPFSTIQAIFEYPGGVQGFFSHSSFLPNTRNRFTIRCRGGVMDVERDELVVTPSGGEARTVNVPASPGMWAELAAHLFAGGPLRYPFAKARRDIVTLEAIDRSIRERRSVDIETA